MILLINPKTSKPTEFQSEYFREPNLGILYLAAQLDKYDIFVDILDLEQYFQLPEFDLKRVIENKITDYNIIGITSLTNNFKFVLDIAKTIKNYDPKKMVILGGPHVSFLFNEILINEESIDFICIFESEESFLQLSQLLLMLYQTNKKLDDVEHKLNQIKGIAYKNSMDALIFTGYPEVINIESLPLPARYKLSQENYYYKVANIIVNRGCPNQCSFCSRQRMFKNIRIRSIKSILSEIRDIISLQTYNYINFYDNINIDRKFFKEFCKIFIEHHIKIPWGCELRIDTLSREDAFLMKQAGCNLVATGIESASIQVLKKNFKYQNPEYVRRGVKNLKHVGIPIQAYFVLGLPGETEHTFQETVNFIKALPLDKDDEINFFAATPYPGSRLWDQQKHFGIKIIEKDFSKYDCQHVIFETKNLSLTKLEKFYKIAKEIEDFFKEN